MTATTVSSTQKWEALERANEIRSKGRLFKEQIGGLAKRDAWMVAARVLRFAPQRVARMPVHVFLEALPGFGDVRVRRVLAGRHIWPLTPVGELKLAEVLSIATALEALARREVAA